MSTRRLVLAAVAALLLLATAPQAEAWYRYSYRYGGIGAYPRYNSWTGGYYRGGVSGYNPYTGRYGVERSYYNPYTGRYGNYGAVYNPYTNRYAYRYNYGY